MDDAPHLPNRVLIAPEGELTPVPPVSSRRIVLAGRAFATDWKATIWTTGTADKLHALCQEWLDLVDAQMSPYRTDSDLTVFNTAPPGSAVALPNALTEVVRHALDIARMSDGAFDPCLLSAVELWGFGARAVPPGLPASPDIDALNGGAGWRDLAWRDGGLLQPGVRLDLCAIAKGYAADGLLARLRAEHGIHAALVEIGGEVAGWGVSPDGSPWWVEVETHTVRRTLVALCGWAAATSGDGQRFFVHDGQVFSHTMDSATCAPVRNNVACVTVFDRACWRADALATALTVMGEAEAMAFAARHDIPCLLTVRDGDGYRERFSPALKAWL